MKTQPRTLLITQTSQRSMYISPSKHPQVIPDDIQWKIVEFKQNLY